jgi:acetyl esterase/lipase
MVTISSVSFPSNHCYKNSQNPGKKKGSFLPVFNYIFPLIFQRGCPMVQSAPCRYFQQTVCVWLFAASAILTLGCSQQQAPAPPAGYANFTLLKLAVALNLEKLVDTKPAIPDSIEWFPDLVYQTAGLRKMTLDLYRRRNGRIPGACLVFIHGGAWKSGDKRDYLAYLLPFASQGYVTISVAYRFSQEAPFPAAVQDVKCAVRWIKKHAAEYGIDPARMALIGGSAGGHLAMMAGYTADNGHLNCPCESDSLDDRVAAVVTLYGPADLTTPFAIHSSVVKKWIGQTWEQAPDRYIQASPLHWLSRNDPATLIFHGTLDEVVPVSQSDSLALHLHRMGVAVEYHRLAGWPHTMDLSRRVNRYCFYYMNRFFKKYLEADANGTE